MEVCRQKRGCGGAAVASAPSDRCVQKHRIGIGLCGCAGVVCGLSALLCVTCCQTGVCVCVSFGAFCPFSAQRPAVIAVSRWPLVVHMQAALRTACFRSTTHSRCKNH